MITFQPTTTKLHAKEIKHKTMVDLRKNAQLSNY